MDFYYEYTLEQGFYGWSSQVESLADASSPYGDWQPDFSWRVNEQPIIMSDGYYSYDELMALLTPGRNEYLSFSVDWPNEYYY